MTFSNSKGTWLATTLPGVELDRPIPPPKLEMPRFPEFDEFTFACAWVLVYRVGF